MVPFTGTMSLFPQINAKALQIEEHTKPDTGSREVEKYLKLAAQQATKTLPLAALALDPHNAAAWLVAGGHKNFRVQ